MAFNYFCEDKKFVVKQKRNITGWLKGVITYHKRTPGEISFIFCSDEQLLEINQTYLKHFYYTDVITFNYNNNDVISGDIYVSIDRILENSGIFGVTFEMELYRVMVHAVLHLLGFEDKTPGDKRKMTEMENHHLNEISFRK